MKSLLSILAGTALLAFAGCNLKSEGVNFSFAKGTKKDFATGLTTSYDGLAVEDAYLLDGEDQRLSSNEVAVGTKISIYFTGVENFVKEGERVFPGMSISVTNAAGEEVLGAEDLFADQQEGFTPEEASVLRSALTIGDPMAAGADYQMTVVVFDKKGTGKINSSVTLKVIE